VLTQVRATAPLSAEAIRMEITILFFAGEIERPLAILEAETPRLKSSLLNFGRVYFASFSRDPERADRALTAMPEAERIIPGYPESYSMLTAMALDMTGRKDEARSLFLKVRTQIDASENSYPGGWSTNVPYSPVVLPGFLGDLKGVRAGVKDFEANARADAFADLDTHLAFAEAFSRAGDPETAFDYIGRITRVAGPSVYLRIKIIPAFDNVREHPRYAVLRTDYEAWAAAQE